MRKGIREAGGNREREEEGGEERKRNEVKQRLLRVLTSRNSACRCHL